MTKNRARIRATKALAASSDLRHPDASYLADNRKLRLPDGTVHDFSTGPLRYLATRDSSITVLLNKVAEEAESKGWSITRLSELDNEPTPDMSDLPKAPALIIAFSDHLSSTGGLFVGLEEGRYEGLNVIIMREPWMTDYEQPLSYGRTIFLRAEAPVLITGGPGSGRNADILFRIKAASAVREALDTLGVPQAAQEFTAHTSGLFLVTGATGCGKTATGAALLRRAHYEKGHAAAAVMDAREASVAEHPGMTIYPVEGGYDTAPAIREAVAAGAKIVFVDGLRDATAIEAALDAALGGVLVIATMHAQASGAAQRLLDAFPDSGNAKIRAKVQLALRGVLEQVLVRRSDQAGRVLASEVWLESADGTDDVLSPVITLGESLANLVQLGAVAQLAADEALTRRW